MNLRLPSLRSMLLTWLAPALSLVAIDSPIAAQCQPCATSFDDNVLSTTCCTAQGYTYAIQANTTGPLAIRAVQIMTNGTSGFLEIWSHDATKNSPKQRLAGNPWVSTSTAPDWKGITLDRVAAIPTNSTYWVVLHVDQATANPSVRRMLRGAGTLYYTSRDRGRTWIQGSKLVRFEWKYRLYCCSLPIPAAHGTYGLPCGASVPTTPTLGAVGLPKLGVSFRITVNTATLTAPAILALGFSARQWRTVPLPLDLSTHGAPGCHLLTSLDLLLPNATVAGRASQPLTIPNLPALMGLPLFQQWMVFDPKANRLGLAFSQGGIGVLGN